MPESAPGPRLRHHRALCVPRVQMRGCGTQEPGSQSWSSAKPGPHPEPWAPAGSDLPQPSPPAARGLESQASSQACVRPLPQRPNGWGSQKAQEHSGGTEVKLATVHEGQTGHRLRHLRVSQLPKAGPMGGRPGVSRTGKPPGWEGGSCSSQEPRGAHWERPLGSNLKVCACSPKALDSHGKLQSSGGLEQRGERSGSCGCTAQPGRNLGWRGPESEWEEDTRERK